MSIEPVGLIAGAGRFPIAFAEKAQAVGLPVVTMGIRGLADPTLIHLSHRFYWTGLARLSRCVSCFQRERVRRYVMAGKIHKAVLFARNWWWLLPDWRTLRFWFHHARRDNKDDTLILGVIADLARDGLVCESALDLCPELLVRHGLLTRRAPNAQEQHDIEFGWELAKEMGRLDVGQSVAVRQRAVLAVEAIEGTDQAIRRAGELCRQLPFVVVKVAKPQQDMRFDVPTVGVATIETMKAAGARVLAIEAGRTIFLDEHDTIARADRYGIAIVAR